MIYITSDHHFWHKNILVHEKEARSIFKDIEDMNAQLIKRWNEVVTNKDTVIHLGDVSFANKQATKEIVSQLKGNKILVMGNHDQVRTINWWKDCGFNEVHRDYLVKYEFTNTELYGINNGNIHKKTVLFCHDPLNGLYATGNTIIIHGHIHSKIVEGYNTPNFKCVCVERTNFYPVKLGEII